MDPIKGKRIVFAVSGSIASYKAVDLASKLSQAGAEVDVILTKAGSAFVSALTFQSVTGRKAYTEKDLWGDEGHVLHISLAQNADLMLVAPATANTITKMALGIADNLLSITALAATCPMMVAPAMDGGMYQHPATQKNLQTLRDRGVKVVGPEIGHLASGLRAIGRMTEPLDLMDEIRSFLGSDGPLKGKKVVVTAGGTREAIDMVRFLGNRSSGKQGFALARAAGNLGAEVVLIAGTVSVPNIRGVKRIDVMTAKEMKEAILAESKEADVLVMAAAVADFRPKDVIEGKQKKEAGLEKIDLERTDDVLKAVAEMKVESGFPKVVVGFAAESENLIENAEKKLEQKKLDLIAANDISAEDAGFGVDTNKVILLNKDGSKQELEKMSKDSVAEVIMRKVVEMLSE
jgi:phosphopantothenoylcysteine decarboxylase/phosphopantothenate--cysteine ligase